jgi:hypothetical protein
MKKAFLIIVAHAALGASYAQNDVSDNEPELSIEIETPAPVATIEELQTTPVDITPVDIAVEIVALEGSSTQEVHADSLAISFEFEDSNSAQPDNETSNEPTRGHCTPQAKPIVFNTLGDIENISIFLSTSKNQHRYESEWRKFVLTVHELARVLKTKPPIPKARLLPMLGSVLEELVANQFKVIITFINKDDKVETQMATTIRHTVSGSLTHTNQLTKDTL